MTHKELARKLEAKLEKILAQCSMRGEGLRSRAIDFALALWRDGNDSGLGYAGCECPGDNCGCDIDDLAEGLSGKLVKSSMESSPAVYETAEGLIAVQDVYGPWAVQILTFADCHE